MPWYERVPLGDWRTLALALDKPIQGKKCWQMWSDVTGKGERELRVGPEEIDIKRMHAYLLGLIRAQAAAHHFLPDPREGVTTASS